MTDFLSNKRMIRDAMMSVTSVTLEYYENKDLTKINIPKQIYIKQIADNTFAIINIFSELVYISKIIRKFTQDQLNVNNTEEIIYHLKNYFIRISSLQDLAKNLISNTFSLGIPENKCTIELLFKNEYTKNSKSISVLTDLRTYIKEFRIQRNKIIHNGEFEDIRIGPLVLLNYYKFESLETVYDIKKIDKLINENLENISFSINEEIEILKSSFDNLYDSLQGIYDSKIQDFNSNN
jgi:hypothetical protein